MGASGGLGAAGPAVAVATAEVLVVWYPAAVVIAAGGGGEVE